MTAFTPEQAMLVALILPALGSVLIALSDKSPNRRELVTLTTAAVLFADVVYLFKSYLEGARPTLESIELIPGLPLAFEIEPLGMVFATIASGLWIINSLYSIGYMRGNNENHQTRFYMAFAIAISAAQAIAFSANMFTLFVFYEVLTLSTYPLVAHKETEDARSGARIYLGILMTTSIGFLMTGIIWTFVSTGTLDFTPGGILAGNIDGPEVAILLALYMFGTGKAALMPFHRWLPSAMVAPTPVSALLHAVAVVKAGVFTVLKVVVYIFGLDFLRETNAAEWLMWVAGYTILAASLIAMTKDNLKARLAYSTVSQLSYVTLGAALATNMGVIGGGMQIVMHAVGKMTLFMCAGAIYVAHHKTEISDMDGLGRVMPFTYAAFFVGALSIIGLPPMGGAWSKFMLMMAAADTGQLIMMGVLMVSSLLNVAYLLPIVVNGFFRPLPEQGGHEHAIEPGKLQEAPFFCVIAPCITAVGCLALFIYADPIRQFIARMVE